MSEVKNICGYCGEIVEDVYSAGWVVGKNEVYHYYCSKIVVGLLTNKKVNLFNVPYTKEKLELLSKDENVNILSISGNGGDNIMINYEKICE